MPLDRIPQASTKAFAEKILDLAPKRFSMFRGDNRFHKQIRKLLGEFVEEQQERLGILELSHEHALGRVLSRGLDIATVIDVGASNGHWSRKVKKDLLPDAAYYLIEGFDTWREDLEALKNADGQFNYIIAAAGDTEGKVYFLEMPDHPTQGHAYDQKPDDRYNEVPQVTIDGEIAKHGLKGPFFVKLDTHGREGEILGGAAETLKETNLLMIEVNNFEDRGRMRFHELCTFLEERGFRCADIAEPTWRKSDQMFWQCDLLFIRADREEFSRYGYG